jgi:hypothetical protein
MSKIEQLGLTAAAAFIFATVKYGHVWKWTFGINLPVRQGRHLEAAARAREFSNP